MNEKINQQKIINLLIFDSWFVLEATTNILNSFICSMSYSKITALNLQIKKNFFNKFKLIKKFNKNEFQAFKKFTKWN